MQNEVQRYYGSINAAFFASVENIVALIIYQAQHSSWLEFNIPFQRRSIHMLVTLLVKFTVNCNCANNI